MPDKVGHSQGSTAFFVMMSERPEYNAKIKMMHALAPVAYIDNAISPVLRVADIVPITLHVSPFYLFVCIVSLVVCVCVRGPFYSC